MPQSGQMYFTGIKVELKEYIECESDENDTDSIKTSRVSAFNYSL